MEQTNLFIALGSLLIFALILASAARRYQEFMAERRMRIKRLLRGVDMVRDLLGRITGCPLPIELERVLHQDILARFQKVREIDARYAGIEALITDAQQAGNQVVGSQRFDIQDKPQLQKITRALAEMIDFLRNGRLLNQLTTEQVENYTELTGVRRLECIYRYHMETARKRLQEGELRDALRHCNSIRAFLKEHGPASSQVKTWFAEAEELRKELNEASDSSVPAA